MTLFKREYFSVHCVRFTGTQDEPTESSLGKYWQQQLRERLADQLSKPKNLIAFVLGSKWNRSPVCWQGAGLKTQFFRGQTGAFTRQIRKNCEKLKIVAGGRWFRQQRCQKKIQPLCTFVWQILQCSEKVFLTLAGLPYGAESKCARNVAGASSGEWNSENQPLGADRVIFEVAMLSSAFRRSS